MRATWIHSASVLALTTSAVAEASETVTYKYDALGRLVSTSISGGPSSGVVWIYTLDPAGNRSRVQVSGTATPSPTPTPTNGPVTVADASFEQPSIGNYSYSYRPTAAGMSFISNAGITANGGFGFPTPPDGVQNAFLQYGNSKIIMNFSGATPGATYVVKFMAINRPGYGGHVFSVVYAGQTLATMTAASSWQSYTTGSFAAAQSSGTIEFDCGSPGIDAASGIDAVQIVPAGGGSVADGSVASSSFESPVVTSYAYLPSVSGVSFTYPAGIAQNGGHSGSPRPTMVAKRDLFRPPLGPARSRRR